MSASKTKPYRYLIAIMLDDLRVGARFKPSTLHITILPWFALESDEGPFLNWFYKHFDNLSAFEATAVKRAMFGPNKDVPVSVLQPQDKLKNLHELALSWFGDVGARWAERDPYVGDDYVPHIAQRQGYAIEDGQSLPISSVTLFKAKRHEDQIRVVAAKAVLNGQA